MITESWIPASLRRVLIGEERSFHTRLTIQECSERLVDVLANPRQHSVYGALTATGFAVKRNPVRRNADPVAYGHWTMPGDMTPLTILFALPKHQGLALGIFVPVIIFMWIRSAFQLFAGFGNTHDNAIVYFFTIMGTLIYVQVWRFATRQPVVDEQLLNTLAQCLELEVSDPSGAVRDFTEQWFKRPSL